MTEPAINHWGDQPSGHGLLARLDTIEDELVGLLDLNLDHVDVADRKTALVRLDRLVAMQHALSLRLLAGGDRIGTDAGNRDAVIWLAGHTGLDPRAASGRVKLAKDLEYTWARTATALAAGEVSVEQARVIVAALNRLTTSTEVTPEHLALAEKTLLAEAGRHGPASLTKIGKRILEVIDPARFEAAEGDALAREEAAALRKLFFHLRTNGDGTTDIHARVATVIAERLRVILEAYTNLRRRPAAQHSDQQAGDQQAGDQQAGDQQAGEPADVHPEQATERGGVQPTVHGDVQVDEQATERVTGQAGEHADGQAEQEPDREPEDLFEDPGEPSSPPHQPGEPSPSAHPNHPNQPNQSSRSLGESGRPGWSDQPGQDRGPGGSGSLLGQRLPPVDQLRGEAFAHLLEHLDPDLLPRHGGDATTLIVNIPLQALTSGVGAATLGYDPATGERISAGEARRLACNAGIIPVVLGGESEVLDLGRTRRQFNAPQRKAIRIRDKECCAEGCSVDATWCDAHHWEQWVADQGATDLENGGLLCPFHHRRAHDPRYRVEFLTNGKVRFHRHS